MNDEPWRRDEVESPCVNVCLLHPATGLCIGCHRTREEIARWSTLPAAERQRVAAELPLRQASPGRRGGRAARLKKHQQT